MNCCGNCKRFDAEDISGGGWCTAFDHATACGGVCEGYEKAKPENKKTRSEYHRRYHEEHREEAALRKADERDRRERCRSYWYSRLILGREMPALVRNVSAEMLEQERVRYLELLDEPCEVVHVPAEVVSKRKVTTEEDEE